MRVSIRAVLRAGFRSRPDCYGPIVDESALVEALRSDSIAGAALDVFDQEPLPAPHPFLSLDNVVLTPHVGYVTKESYEVFFVDVVDDILGFLADDPVRVLNE